MKPIIVENIIVKQTLKECLQGIEDKLSCQEIAINNHIEHINKDISVINVNIGSLKNDVGKVKTDIEWIKKIGFMLFASMLALIGGIILNII